MLTIAIVGNHRVIYCTEAELAWTFEQMGHKVVRFQENVDSTEHILTTCIERGVDLFLYVHTHGWSTPGLMSFDELLSCLRKRETKTASFHLDRFWGLFQYDKRESKIGQHHFWHTDRIFTADGGHQDDFEKRGVKHTWLPPAIAARHCFRGQYRPELAVDVAFVGSKFYHVEYPFRGQLIEWLSHTYGPRFRRFAGDAGGVIREAKLNDLYASVKVVVGDSCFAGAPYYWSDRISETLGRGGFLVHPATKGLQIEGLVTFEPGDLDSLKRKIDHYLEVDEDRFDMTEKAMADVKANHTYTNRMAELLRIMEMV